MKIFILSVGIVMAILLSTSIHAFDCNKLPKDKREECKKPQNEQIQRYLNCKDKPKKDLLECYCKGWHEKLRPYCVQGVTKRISCLDKEGEDFIKCDCEQTTPPQSFDNCVAYIKKNVKCEGKSGNDLKHCHLFMPATK